MNRALSGDEIGPYVQTLAMRIASFPPEAVRLAKRAVHRAELPLSEGLVEEDFLFQMLLRTEDAQQSMRRFLDLGGQTPEGEQRIAELSQEVASEKP